jgi:hypothetical protein
MNFNLTIKDNTVAFIEPQEKLVLQKEYPFQLTLESFFETFKDEQEDKNFSSSSIHVPLGTKKQVYSASFQEGISAEERFIQACEKRGWLHVPTSLLDDKIRRIDCVMKVNKDFLLVDIKGAKRLNRMDKDVQYRYHWLELHATGSLFSGESKMMALEIDEGKFALFDKKDVQTWIKPLLENQTPVLNSKQALLRPYQREGKIKEWITLVDVKDLMPICKGIV